MYHLSCLSLLCDVGCREEEGLVCVLWSSVCVMIHEKKACMKETQNRGDLHIIVK